MPYALFVPSSYDASREWPLIVGLHGLGRPYDWVMSYDGYVDLAERDGYILVTPKGYHPRGWYGSRGPGIPRGLDRDGAEGLPDNLGELAEQDVMNVLRLVVDEFNIDDDRIYLWGHSMGGGGTYHLAAKYPDVWAALGLAAPAASGSPDQLASFRHIPVMVLQGDEDGAVPVTRTREWVARMRELGMEHVYVEIVVDSDRRECRQQRSGLPTDGSKHGVACAPPTQAPVHLRPEASTGIEVDDRFTKRWGIFDDHRWGILNDR